MCRNCTVELNTQLLQGSAERDVPFQFFITSHLTTSSASGLLKNTAFAIFNGSSLLDKVISR